MRRHLASTGSTNDDARAWAEEGAPHGATVVADAQTAGRGRLGRAWTAGPGENLAMSVVIRSPRPASEVGWIPLAAAVATARACGPGFGIKWPNDVLAPDGRKVAGVLCEAEWRQGRLRFAVVGVGVNVGAAPPDVPTATSLRAAGSSLSVAEVLDALHAGLLALVDRAPDEIAAAWRERSATLGRRVRVADREGTAEDLLADGGLLLRGDDGERVEIRAGDVALVGGIAEGRPGASG